MKKRFGIFLFVLAILPVTFISCNDDKDAEVNIAFNPSSTVNIPDEGIFTVTGTIRADQGTIDDITIMCLYKDVKIENNKNVVVNKTEFIANTSSKEMKKTGKNEYKFTLTQENTSLLSKITVLYGIRVNVRMKSGERFSQTWDMKGQFNK